MIRTRRISRDISPRSAGRGARPTSRDDAGSVRNARPGFAPLSIAPRSHLSSARPPVAFPNTVSQSSANCGVPVAISRGRPISVPAVEL